jgi:phenylacetate-CoA ligase
MQKEEIMQIPFYREKFKDPEKSWLDHTITKQEISRSFPTLWITPQLKKAIDQDQIEWAATSGSTSDRLQIIRPKNWWQQEYLWLDNQLFPGQSDVSRAVLTTALCSANVCSMTQPAYAQRCIDRALFLNTQQDPNCWLEDDLNRMNEEINLWQPDYLLVDPVYLLIFIKKLQKFNISVTRWPFSLIVTGYELLTHFNRMVINHYFKNIPVLQLYGSTETGFHILENRNGLLSCFDRDAELQLKHWKDDIYEVLISSWKNLYMPLVNYEIGDLVKIEGAAQAFIFNPDKITSFYGRKNDRVQIGNQFYYAGDFENCFKSTRLEVAQYQISCRNNMLIFKYTTIKGAPLNSSQFDELKNQLSDLINHETRVSCEHENSISPESSGKFSIISN